MLPLRKWNITPYSLNVGYAYDFFPKSTVLEDGGTKYCGETCQARPQVGGQV